MNKLESLIDSLNRLDNLLYSCDGCLCGGPLHVVLDDGNVLDKDMAFSRRWIAENEHGYDKYVLTISSGILDILEELSPAQRRLWWHERHSVDFMARLPALCDKTFNEDENGDLLGYEPWVKP